MKLTTLITLLVLAASLFAQDKICPKEMSMNELIKLWESTDIMVREDASHKIVNLWDKWTDKDLGLLIKASEGEDQEISKRAQSALNELKLIKDEIKWSIVLHKLGKALIAENGTDSTIEITKIKIGDDNIFENAKRIYRVNITKIPASKETNTLYIVGLDGKMDKLTGISDMADFAKESGIVVKDEKAAKSLIKIFCNLIIQTVEFKQIAIRGASNLVAGVNINDFEVAGNDGGYKTRVTLAILPYGYEVQVNWEIKLDENNKVLKLKANMKLNEDTLENPGWDILTQ